MNELHSQWVRATGVGVVGAGLAIIGAFLPWVKINAPFIGEPERGRHGRRRQDFPLLP